jgi:hypothetical protein
MPALLPLATVLASALAATGAGPRSSPDATQHARLAACAAEALRPLVGPDGVKRAWPEIDALPSALGGDGRTVISGTLLSDEGLTADGFRHTLYVDHAAGAAYVVEDGGFAGLRRVYGPLPLPRCAASTSTGH